MPPDHGESEPLLHDIERQEDNTHPDDPLDQVEENRTSPNRTSLELAEESSDPSATNKHVARIVSKIPDPIRRLVAHICGWSRGPPNPRPHCIAPLLPAVQELPIRMLHRFVPNWKHRIFLFIFYLGLWFMTFTLMFRKSQFATEIEHWGVPVNLGCGDAYWVRNNKCGLDGNLCRPFNGSGLAFRCPASCDTFEVKNPRAVGDQEIIYAPVVVGGPADGNDTSPVYRGDSFVCVAALHSGLIDSENGGCGIVQLVGESKNYIGSLRNGIQSVSFDSYFPLSYTFLDNVECDARDLRWDILALDIVFMAILSLFMTSPRTFFFIVMPAIFWHVGMVSDPPPHTTVASLIERLIGRFLPGMFVAWVMYEKMGIKRTLSGLTAHVEKVVLWLGACWVGALNNYTFDRIPINRLTPHDIDQQPGAKAALAFIIIALVILVAVQAWFFRQEGRLIKYLKYYIFIASVLVFFILIPHLNLRIHHYFLALLLLPGTSMQTRLSLLLQGLLVGLYINGIARWGFDPVLQTSNSLQGDAVHNSPLPVILPPNVTNAEPMSSITFEWMPPPGPRYDGISILVNDVERYRSYFDEEQESRYTWTRNASLGLPEYFRFGYMEGTMTWDFTKAGKWDVDGSWVEMAAGPSRVKRDIENAESESEWLVRQRKVK